MYSLPTLSSLYPKPKKKRMKRFPTRSLAYWGILAVEAVKKNREDCPEEGIHLQRLSWDVTIALHRYRASVHISIGASNYQKTSDSKHLQIKDSEQGNSKLLGRITVIVFNVPSHIFTIFQNLSKIRGATPLVGHHSIHQIWARAHLFWTLIYSICKISSIFDGNAWSKNFQNTNFFITSFEKCEQQTHTLWTRE